MNPAATAAATKAAAAGMGVVFFMLTIGAVMAILWVMSLVDVIRNEYEGSNTKIIWLVLLLLAAPLGTILYQMIGKKQKL